ncbi:hypothetical protein H0H87_000710 [Tephrocybe sp. NHM501043]|nr:hypothetical protein H0H87_000710 [Tephrocybe sp. NHM501043]
MLVKTQIFARMSPDEKNEVVERLQSLGYTVLMCGDGANDCAALKAADVGISLSEAEASVAAPFTTSTPDIGCVLEVIKQGRSALVTSFSCFKALYSLIQFTTVTLLYSFASILGDFQFLYIDLFIIIPVAVTMGRTLPFPRIYPKPPTASLVSKKVLASIIGQILITSGTQLWAYLWVRRQTWYTPPPSQSPGSDEDLAASNFENTALFLVSCFQYILVAAVFSIGPPYRKSMWTNGWLMLSVSALTTFNLVVLLSPPQFVAEKLDLMSLEYSARVLLLLVIAINVSASVVFEHWGAGPAGQLTETCVITLTPITDTSGQPAVEEVKKCTLAYDNSGGTGNGTGTSVTTSGTTFTTSPTAGNTISPSTETSTSSSSDVTATSSTQTSTNTLGSFTATQTPPPTGTSSGTGASSVTGTSSANGTSTASGITTSSGTSSTPGSSSAPPVSGIKVNGITTVTGIPTQTATTSAVDLTATPTSTTDSNGGTVAPDSTNPSGATAAAAESPSDSSAAFEMPGKKLSVLPIGLGVFAGISVIALIVVGLVTYERTKYRKAFRQRKLAESGATMGYGGMALVITFLVDNCVEWMTKLPPGFVHELPQHIQLYPEVDETTGVPVIDLDHFCCGAHGFSALIETAVNDENSHYTLFDTGPDDKSLVRNVMAMKVPVDKIEHVIISHWHRDHTGGLLSFLTHRESFAPSTPCIVDVHPDRPFARGIAPGPTFETVICALPKDPTFELIERAGGVVEKSREGHVAAGDTVWISGEIPRLTDFESGMLGAMRWFQEPGKLGQWIKEKVG